MMPPGPSYNFAPSLNFARRVVHDVLLGWAGLKEGVVEVSERLSRRVQLLKWSAEASECERALDELYRQLGCRIEEYRASGPVGGPDPSASGGSGGGPDEGERAENGAPATGGPPQAGGPLSTDHEVTRLTAAVLEAKAGLERVERQIRILKAEGRDDEITAFLEALRRTGGRAEVITLPPDSPAIGLCVADLRLSDEVRLVGFAHGPAVFLPRDDARLAPGDRLFMVGLDRAMDEVVARLAWPARR